MRGFDLLLAIAAKVPLRKIIGKDEDDIRFFGREESRCVQQER
jgi:hypothetical protein